MVFLTITAMLLAILATVVLASSTKDDELRAARDFDKDQERFGRAIEGGNS